MYYLSGDCWFVAAASVLATGPRNLFERVVPLDQSFDRDEYAGELFLKAPFSDDQREIIYHGTSLLFSRIIYYCQLPALKN